MNKDLSYYKKISGTLLLLHAIITIIVHLVWISFSEHGFLQSNNELMSYLISTLIMQGICILLPSLFVIWYFKMPYESIVGEYDRISGGLFISAIIGIPAAIVFIGINNGIVYIMYTNNLYFPEIMNSTGINFSGIQGTALAVLIAVLLPGIIEEIMFRGIILGAMLNCSKPFWGILFSAIAFSLFHSDPIFLMAPLLAGLLLGFVRYKSGNLFAAVLTHVSMNLTILLISPILPRLTTEYFKLSTQNNVLYASLLSSLVASVALIPLIIVLSSSKTRSISKNKKVLKGIFPFDYKFVLGLLVLFLTVLFVYFNL